MKKVENNKLKKVIKKNLKPYITIDQKFIKFDDIEIEKYNFITIKTKTNDIDINKIVVSNELSFGKKVFKYFLV